jgi:tetratricopeptide (TPR) repeat protein
METTSKSLNLLSRLILTASLACGLVLAKLEVSQAESSAATSKAKITAQTQRSLELNERGVIAIKSKDFSQAEDLFKEALNIDSRNITAVFNLAGMYITNKKEQQAVALLTEYTKSMPMDAGLHARLGDAYFGSQDPKNALKSYESAYKLDSNYPGLSGKLATLYAMSNNLNKSAQMYETALKANPKDIQSLRNLSNVYLGLGKPKQSVTTAKKALQLSSSAETYVTLGNAYQELNDFPNALNSYQRAKELGYKDPNLGKVIDAMMAKTTKGTT